MKVYLSAYSEQWSEIFSIESEKLSQLFPVGTRFEHIGSTSIKGMVAKPIIDILAILSRDDFCNIEGLIDGIISKADYVYPLWIAEYSKARKHMLILPNTSLASKTNVVKSKDDCLSLMDNRKVSVTIVCERANQVIKYLKFRDVLRGSQELQDAYASLKRKITSDNLNSSEDYAKAKDSFIENVLMQYEKYN